MGTDILVLVTVYRIFKMTGNSYVVTNIYYIYIIIPIRVCVGRANKSHFDYFTPHEIIFYKTFKDINYDKSSR